jgi:hypothetical protein
MSPARGPRGRAIQTLIWLQLADCDYDVSCAMHPLGNPDPCVSCVMKQRAALAVHAVPAVPAARAALAVHAVPAVRGGRPGVGCRQLETLAWPRVGGVLCLHLGVGRGPSAALAPSLADPWK